VDAAALSPAAAMGDPKAEAEAWIRRTSATVLREKEDGAAVAEAAVRSLGGR
jgi:hypothetical protein